MTKLNSKQWTLIALSFVAAAVINWLVWLLVMGKPGEIGGVYHFLTILCLACAFIVIGDRFAKTGIYK